MQTNSQRIGFYSNSLSNVEKNSLSQVLERIKKQFPTHPHFIELIYGQSEQIELLLCFSDTDVLNAVNMQHSLNILSIELPGDNSFFAQIPFIQLETALTQFLHSADYTIEKRTVLAVSIATREYYALNDVYISSSKIGQRFRFEVLLDSVSLIGTDSGNAILVSTPTGSTALALNLRGAILHPAAQVFQLQTIASRNPLNNHQIVPNTSILTINVIETDFPLTVNYDNHQFETSAKELMIRKATFEIAFVKFAKPQSNGEDQQLKLKHKIEFEDTQSLTSTAKFVLHILQDENEPLPINTIMKKTSITNQKTLRCALNLLMEKGLIKRKENMNDLREHLYYNLSLND